MRLACWRARFAIATFLDARNSMQCYNFFHETIMREACATRKTRLERRACHELTRAVAKRKRADRLTLLGHSDAKLAPSPAEARLETFPNPAPQRNYHIHFETDDFTCVCPVTGQPDFARIDIDYVPDRLCVESKSLKFYLASYRNERGFNEAVTNRILDDFVKACAPREAIVTAQFSARGGIALTVRAEYPDSNPKERRSPDRRGNAVE